MGLEAGRLCQMVRPPFVWAKQMPLRRVSIADRSLPVLNPPTSPPAPATTSGPQEGPLPGGERSCAYVMCPEARSRSGAGGTMRFSHELFPLKVRWHHD